MSTREKTRVGEVKYVFDDLSPDSWKSSGTTHARPRHHITSKEQGGRSLGLPLADLKFKGHSQFERRAISGLSRKEGVGLIPAFCVESIEHLGGRRVRLFP